MNLQAGADGLFKGFEQGGDVSLIAGLRILMAKPLPAALVDRVIEQVAGFPQGILNRPYVQGMSGGPTQF